MNGRQRIRAMTMPVLIIQVHVRDSVEPLRIQLGKQRTLSIGSLTEEQVEEQAMIEVRGAIRTIFETERP